MRRRLPLLVLLLGLLAGGCSKRERSNIFDPGNPVTRGQPIGFTALADNGVVRLSWQPVRSEGLVGFELLRKVAGETDYTPISDLLPQTASTFNDFGAANGVDHFYRLYYVLDEGRAGLPAEAVATPGPLRAWVADQNGRLVRLTPDGRHVMFLIEAFAGPAFVAANPRTGLVWVSDPAAGEIDLYNPGTGGMQRFIAGRPGAIGLDPVRRTAWVCDDLLGVVHQVSETAGPVSPQLGPLQDPLSCAVVPFDGSVWVCEKRVNLLRRISTDGTTIASRAFDFPSRVAVDSLTLEAWVTSLDGRRVVRLSPGGVPLDTVALSGPIGVAVDARRGRIWIADAAAGAVVALDRDGNTALRIGGLPLVTEIAVDLRTGDAWATRPSAGEVVRIKADGSQVIRLGGLGAPYGIGLANAAG